MSESNIKFFIRVNYKSGIQEEFWVKDFKTESNQDGLSSVEWTLCFDEKNDPEGYKSPRPVTIGVDNIESIWQLKIEDID